MAPDTHTMVFGADPETGAPAAVAVPNTQALVAPTGAAAAPGTPAAKKHAQIKIAKSVAVVAVVAAVAFYAGKKMKHGKR